MDTYPTPLRLWVDKSQWVVSLIDEKGVELARCAQTKHTEDEMVWRVAQWKRREVLMDHRTVIIDFVRDEMWDAVTGHTIYVEDNS